MQHLRAILIMCLLLIAATHAGAQQQSRNIRIAVQAERGSSTDLAARAVGSQLARSAGTIVEVVNLAYGSTATAGTIDTNTLIFARTDLANADLLGSSFSPVTSVGRSPFILASGKNSQLGNFKSGSTKSIYTTTPAMKSQLQGLNLQGWNEVQLESSDTIANKWTPSRNSAVFAPYSDMKQLIECGQLQPLAAPSSWDATPKQHFPSIRPNLNYAYYAFFASTTIPRDTLEQLQSAIREASGAPATSAQLQRLGIEPENLPPIDIEHALKVHANGDPCAKSSTCKLSSPATCLRPCPKEE